MSNGQYFEEEERERKIRRKVFYLTFATLTLISGGFLIWKLSILILPIIVGCLLAFVFRPVKEARRFAAALSAVHRLAGRMSAATCCRRRSR